MMYKCGLVSVSFRQNSVREIIKAVKKAGLNCIEWGSDVHALRDDKERLNAIAKLCKENQIEISSYGTYFRLGQNPVFELQGYIDAAKILGTDILRVWCGTKGYADYTEDELCALIEDCKASAKIAKDNGVILCLECHNGTVTDCLDGALKIMSAVDSDNFKMYWQPNQYKTTQENIGYAKGIAPYTKHIHVFNWDGDNKYPLVDAEDLWKCYISCFDGDRTLLLEFMPDGDIMSLDAEAKALFEITEGAKK